MKEPHEFPKAFLEKLMAVTNKRAKVVIEHILEHGYITTEDLEKTYGYNHPPRAARDVREQGIPLKTFRVKSSDGRSIAAYKFGNPEDIEEGRLGGRKVFAKQLKDTLYLSQKGKCAICAGNFEKRYLQIDHKVPYAIAGDVNYLDSDEDDYMLLCAGCNRAKSWSCEHCPNWETKSSPICAQCYWAFPDEYTHIALREVRRLDIFWDSSELEVYEQLKNAARNNFATVPDYVKIIIKKHFSEDG